MSDGPSTYAATRPVPYLLALVASQVVTCPVRYGAAGALVTPSAGTLVVTRPDGTVLAGTTVTIVGGVASCTMPSMAAETASAGWSLVWSLTISGVAYPVRFDGYACTYVPTCSVSVGELFRYEPELRSRVPQMQSDRGDGTGWQPQVDDAYYALLRKMIDDGNRPWLVSDMSGTQEWIRTLALMRCVRALSTASDDVWGKKAVDYRFEHKAAEAALKVHYDGDDAGTRRPVSSSFRLAPAGRPVW